MNYYNNYFGTYIKFFFTLFVLFIYPINSNSHPEDYKKLVDHVDFIANLPEKYKTTLDINATNFINNFDDNYIN